MTGPTLHSDSALVPCDVPGVRVVPQREWDALVSRLGGDDVYLRLSYHRMSACLEPEGATPVLLHLSAVGGELALPLLLRPLPDGAGFDATSAYGYGGPIARGAIDLVLVADALDAWALANQVVCTFLRMHPLLGNDELAPARSNVVELGATVAWDVNVGRDLMASMHSHHRRAVRKAERAGVTTVVRASPASLSGFRELYDATMHRQGADGFYFFPDSYWASMLADCGGELVLVDAELEGEVIASLLCLAHGAWLHYHLGASADAARSIGASNACFLAAAQWAQARGMQTFHLGGGVGGGTQSPLFVFKHRYDPSSAPRRFSIAKVVHDAGRYLELAGTSDISGYFPPWRSTE